MQQAILKVVAKGTLQHCTRRDSSHGHLLVACSSLMSTPTLGPVATLLKSDTLTQAQKPRMPRCQNHSAVALARSAAASGPRERAAQGNGFARLTISFVTATSGTISTPFTSLARTISTVARSVATVMKSAAFATSWPGQMRRPEPKATVLGSRTDGSSLPSGVRKRSGLKRSGSG
jgi:hypothetical protein